MIKAKSMTTKNQNIGKRKTLQLKIGNQKNPGKLFQYPDNGISRESLDSARGIVMKSSVLPAQIAR